MQEDRNEIRKEHITQEDIDFHKNMKKQHEFYPKLPKIVLKDVLITPNNEGLLITTLNSFKDRVDNWERAQSIKLENIG